MNNTFYKELVEYNEPTFQYAKLAEELAELLEICLKRVNKKEPHHPPIAKFIEEIGDVQLRMNVLIEQEGIGHEVTNRIFEKSGKLKQWKAEGKYKGGL